MEKQLTVNLNSRRLEDDPFQWTFADTQTREASETLSPKLTAMKSESSAMIQPQMLNPVTPVEQQPINEPAQPIEPKLSSMSVISEKTEPRESEPPKLQQMEKLATNVEPQQVLPQAKASWHTAKLARWTVYAIICLLAFWEVAAPDINSCAQWIHSNAFYFMIRLSCQCAVSMVWRYRSKSYSLWRH